MFNDSVDDNVVAADCPFLFSLKDSVILPTNVSELNTFLCGNLSREIKGSLSL